MNVETLIVSVYIIVAHLGVGIVLGVTLVSMDKWRQRRRNRRLGDKLI